MRFVMEMFATLLAVFGSIYLADWIARFWEDVKNDTP